MRKVVLAVFYFLIVLSYAQNKNGSAIVYDKTILMTSQNQNEFLKALKAADSLYVKAGTPLLKTKSLMLSALLYHRSGDIGKCIEYAVKAEEIVEQTNLVEWKAQVYIFLAAQYRILKLYGHSKKYMNKAFNTTKLVQNKNITGSINGLMWQEIAYYEIEKKDYRKSIESVMKSQHFFNISGYHDDFSEASNEHILGLNYYHLNNMDASLRHYLKALNIAKSMPGYCIKGFIYNGLAKVYLSKDNLRQAKKYAELASGIANKSNCLQLKNEVYDTFHRYYTIIQDVEELAVIQEKKDSITDLLASRSTLFINDFYQKMDKKNNILQQKNHIKNWIIIVICLILMINIIYFTQYRENFKMTFNRINRILKKRVSEKKSPKDIYNNYSAVKIADLEDDEVQDNEAGVMMTQAIEQKLLLRLREFENSTLFTKKNISLSYLATYCGANTRYISYIINTYKKKDFNNYINELRIKYIVFKLEKMPQYRKYKVATLAEEAGFSSPNKFATVFKKEVSVSPSLYIKHLDDVAAG
ncbi:helix-turn-helix domain-containing protein [Elizabethkingia occulta]|uniref:helix-turn-helix domain-containing protein n=1 Tax=Elizabethkingia occulta TaxID=1867263 RepID=UPI00099B14C2|nr:helix-turn-helix domain-containing protein [Elizabethkingia occulta]OPB85035.1 AraC family transcriptional regulator [Elizabethkingia occulta]